MRICFVFIAFVSLLCSCNKTEQVKEDGVLVKVKDKILNRSFISGQLPRGISSSDSLLYAENMQKKWIKDVLIYDLALQNLDVKEKNDIDKLVEDYRNSLIRYRFQEQLIKEKLSAEITESDKLSYYEQNKAKFVLDKPLLKGIFLKIPIDAPGIEDIKKWYKSSSEALVEKIEKYSVQNAINYDYFCDRWVDFDEVLDNIPLHISNADDFLKTRKYVEVSDSSYWYLLNITDYMSSGKVAPYEYSSPKIVEMMTNLKKVDFLRKFEDDLYNDAVKSGDVKFYAEP